MEGSARFQRVARGILPRAVRQDAERSTQDGCAPRNT